MFEECRLEHVLKLDASDLVNIKSLQILDISRNGINSISPGTFRAQRSLKYLDLSLNSLRTIEDDALEGLDALQTLIIRDNNILLIPGSALGRLPKLSNLYLDYNRIAALSSDILGSIEAESVKYLSLSRNIIRELPAGCFRMFSNLIYLDLSSNSLVFASAEMFTGLENSLMELKLSGNKLSNIGSIPFGLRNLRRLDLSRNNLAELSKEVFNGLDYLLHLNLSSNTHLTPFPIDLLRPLTRLQIIDLSNTGIERVPSELFANMMNLRVIRLADNGIQEIEENTFFNLRNLTEIDLSHNRIMTIKPSSFVNVMNLRRLYLKGNQLSAFKGEIFNTGTGLEILDLSDNKLSYLFPSSFRIHPRLNKLLASNNKFAFFPAELIQSLQYLEEISLSKNLLVTVDELDFARLPRLKKLYLSDNLLESVNEMAFHNSTQLQILDLSHNKLERLGERTFEGLMRLQMLNLEGNLLAELPENIFEAHKLHMLEYIDLSHNKFEIAPLRPLQRQHLHINSIDLSNNLIREIPSDNSVIINAKSLDLSFNPLSESAIQSIFGEPKTVRELSLAGVNIKTLPVLETPYLQFLNLSHNKIDEVRKESFGRTSLLEKLDLSSNQLDNLRQLSESWPFLTFLKYLDLSNNSFEMVAQGDLDNLDILDTLKIHNLPDCTRIEKMAFKNLPNLAHLKACNYPRLGYLDVQGILQELPTLQSLDIEVKDSAVGADQIQPANHPRLKELAISGYRLKSISSSMLAGLKSKHLTVALRNTSLTFLPPAILFPVPRSSKLDLDISGSMITALTPQLLTSFEDRRNSFTLKGLNSNPIHCDCNSRTLRRWLPHAKLEDLKCVTPDNLYGRLLIEIGDDELTCDHKQQNANRKTPTSLQTKQPTQPRVTIKSSNYEPDIIFSSSASTSAPPKLKNKPAQIKQAHIGNDDTVIIAIVGGVVAFIALLILVVCIVRCRTSSPPNYLRGHMPVMPPNIPLSQGSIINGGGPPSTAIYAVPPYAQNYATLSHKQQQQMSASQMRLNYSTMNNRYPQSQPYIIYNSDEKNYS
uniref:CSON004247 protein n=1 Tax=Culicoides sonorensis TaxID=179676 RepID=A0A336MP89_CULSO